MASNRNQLKSTIENDIVTKKSTSENQHSLSDQKTLIIQNHKLSQHQSAIWKYEEEWTELSKVAEDPQLRKLRQLAVDGELKVSKFRSVCWALLLGVLSGPSSSWVIQRQCDRERYVELVRQYHTNPRMTTKDDPLSQSEDSTWNQHFCDKELCTVIKQDVIRTFPGVEFFRKTYIEDIMTNILFCYARANPEMCYRQGMHEILAPILFIMHCDQQSLLHIKDLSYDKISGSLKDVLNPKYLEEDSYFIFARIMSEIESFYRIHDLQPTSSGYFPTPVSTNNSPKICTKSVSELEIVRQLNAIRDKILAKADSELNEFLLEMDISLPLFGIRWLRLLFGREFQLLDLLYLWDVLFAVGSHLELTSYILVAMLIAIRENLLSNDYTTCLSCLMKYPNNVDVGVIVRSALHLYKPSKFQSPPSGLSDPYSNKDRSTQNSHEETQKKKLLLLNQKSATLPRSVHSQMSTKNPQQAVTNRKLDNSRPHTASQQLTSNRNDIKPDTSRIRSNSTTASDKWRNDNLQERVHNLQNATAKSTIRIAKTQQLNHDHGVIDGFVENSPEVLKLQLQNAHTVISITRVKLMQYLTVFRRNIPGDSLHELHQAMDGIEELCELLKIKCPAPYYLPPPVEAALEANEASNSPYNQKSRSQAKEASPKTMQISFDSIPPIQISTSSRKTHISDAEAKREFIRSLKTDHDFEIKGQDDGLDSRKCVADPHCSSPATNINGASTHSLSRYEIPDNKITRTAAKILANRKELEMHEFMGMKKSENISIEANRSNDNKMPIIDPSGDRLSPI